MLTRSGQTTGIDDGEEQGESTGDLRFEWQGGERSERYITDRDETVAADEDAGDLGTLCQALSSSCDHITFL